VLDGGRIVAEGTPDELKAAAGAERVRLEMADAASLHVARVVFPQAAVDVALRTLTVTTDGSPTELRSVLATVESHGLAVRRVDTVRPTLDDVFLSLTERRTVAA